MGTSITMPPLPASLILRVKAWLRRGTVTPARMRHVETLVLGSSRVLHLVECDGVRFLVAAGASCISAPVPLRQRSGVPDLEEVS